MPLPFILGAAALLAGGYGVKKGIDAYDDNEAADEYERDANRLKNDTVAKQKSVLDNLNREVDKFGRYRCVSLQDTVGRFISMLDILGRKVKGKEFDIPESVGVTNVPISEMREISFGASKLLSSTSSTITAGTAVYGGVLGAVGMFGTASTGTAIAGLSGAAATNAALAACGGGSLAAGGFGMAGGALFLGAATGGVALAVAGVFASSHFEQKKEKAKTYYYEVKRECEKVDAGTELLRQILRRVYELESVTEGLTERAKNCLSKLSLRIYSFDQNNDDDVCLYRTCRMLCSQISTLAQTPLLDNSGTLTEESSKVIMKSRTILNTQL